MRHILTTAALISSLAFTGTGCVSKATCDDALGREAQTRTALDRARGEVAELKAQHDLLELQLAGKNVSGAVLSTKLWLARAQRDFLARAHEASERRAATMQDVAKQLQRMIDTGDVAVVIRDGRMVIILPSDVVFESGQTDIKPRGRESLALVAGALRTLSGRHLQVAGHTDNVPISTSRFPSNWELSTARAVEVLRFLTKQGVEPAALAAAGYAEFDPVAANEAPEGRAKNRRIEITLMPEVVELPTPMR